MKAQGLARIGRDSDVKFTQDGTPVANVSLAFVFGKKDQNGERLTQWVDSSFWGPRAELLAPYLKKGKQIVAYLDGLHLQHFEKKDGTQGTKLVAKLTDLEFVSDGLHDAQPQEPQQRQRKSANPATGAQGSGFDDMDNEIPF